jgi:hypothetical protein
MRMAVDPVKEIIDRSAQDIRTGWMQSGCSDGVGGQGFQKNAEELLHGYHLELGLGNESEQHDYALKADRHLSNTSMNERDGSWLSGAELVDDWAGIEAIGLSMRAAKVTDC